ncbi:MAG: hypothetical protein NTY99_01925 [DPANN group archaeon]|nr:hypothetical protein [DPANN group archaeon]
MRKNIIKIRKEGDNYLIFTSEGLLLELDENEFAVFKKYGSANKISKEHFDFLSKLVSYGVLEFEDYKHGERKKVYDNSLLNNQKVG